MDASRARLSFESDHVTEHLHHAVIAAGVVLLLAVTALAVREIRFAPRAVAAADESATADVPSEVVSVPSLALAAGQVHVGDAKADAVAVLGAQPVLRQTEEHGALGTREIRAYKGYTVVFEPFERAGELRVAAIYLQ